MTKLFGNSRFINFLEIRDNNGPSDPSIRFINNTNTGIYQSLSDTISFSTGGNERLRIIDTTTTYSTDPEMIIFGDGGLVIPSGNTASRPTTPPIGTIRFNTQLSLFEGFNGTIWVPFDIIYEFPDNLFRIYDDVDNTRQVAFIIDNVSTSTTRTITIPDRNITLDFITQGITETNIPNGGILFSTGTVIESNPTRLFWDNTNFRLGINTNSPSTELHIDGTITVSGPLPGEIRFYEDPLNGTNYLAFRSPSNVPGDVTWILPPTDGSLNSVLTTDGSGNLSWQNVSNIYQSYNEVVVNGNFPGILASLSINAINFIQQPGIEIGLFNNPPSADITIGLDYPGLPAVTSFFTISSDFFAFYSNTTTNYHIISVSDFLSSLQIPRFYYFDFTNADLISGVLQHVHGLGISITTAIIQVYDNTNTLINPDLVEFVNPNRVDIDLQSFIPITGTWRLMMVYIQ